MSSKRHLLLQVYYFFKQELVTYTPITKISNKWNYILIQPISKKLKKALS